ncbi:hypothetical protein LTR53_011830 [Teratosphaeriaceae sp. CCFEE 6253]|nr:hypothetical protein LTR53_011830 [Teratosphaeriaceae sp. CCFEE 6253]
MELTGSQGSASRASEPRRRKAPLITYGRSSKPLSLSGSQFIRRDNYDLPSDDEEPPAADNGSSLPGVDDDGSDSSMLSDEELEAMSRHFKPRSVAKRPARLDVLEASSASSRPSAPPGASNAKTGIFRSVSKAKARSEHRKQLTDPSNETPSGGPACKAAIDPLKVSCAHRKPQSLARRIPVGELTLVNSPPDLALDPTSTGPGIDVQDPIQDQSSQPHKPEINESSDGKTPLTSIRKRLRTPGYRHRALSALRRQQLRQSQSGNACDPSKAVGDGFDRSELKITYQRPVPQKIRKRAAPKSLTYGPLELSGGPLPEVILDCLTDDLQMEPSDGPHHVSSQRHQAEVIHELPKSPSQRLLRRVSFRGKDDVIMAQFAAVSAPRRHRSEVESDDGSESQVDEEESQIDDAEAVVEGFDALEQPDNKSEADSSEDELVKAAPPAKAIQQGTIRPRRQISNRFTPAEDIDDSGPECEDARGSSESRMPGRLPRASKVRRLIETCKPIEDLREAETLVSRSELAVVVDERHPKALHKVRRTRSILKTSTPMVPESTFRPEDTEANTRRNSTAVHADDSRYFTTASQMLDVPDTSRHYNIRRRSAYFDEPRVLVADSERAVPETSPEPVDYTNASQLAVLRRTAGNVWTSDGVPTVAKDLGALTRNVSREHGTLSQSRRRRPSLPFQSPMKLHE